MLLCEAVARGLIQPLCGPDIARPAPSGDKGKNRAEKGVEKTASVHGVFLDPAALQDVRKALEVCQCVYVGAGWGQMYLICVKFQLHYSIRLSSHKILFGSGGCEPLPSPIDVSLQPTCA